ncbi:MAG TPA: hypothetical protein VHY84_00120 [Bryobacteraceae bacterium]|jgi:hypothetical protein|nr:hypothetical protein [Bryobacteraceae bacterium]
MKRNSDVVLRRGLYWLSLAVFFGFSVMNASAVCLKEDGVSVDPSTYGPIISWQAEFRRSTLVLIGKVISAKNVPDKDEPDFWAGTLYKITVDTFLKGAADISIEVFSPNDSGRLPLATHTRYLLFLRKEAGQWTADACGNSAKLTSPFR